jgi:hypothetical protein
VQVISDYITSNDRLLPNTNRFQRWGFLCELLPIISLRRSASPNRFQLWGFSPRRLRHWLARGLRKGKGTGARSWGAAADLVSLEPTGPPSSPADEASWCWASDLAAARWSEDGGSRRPSRCCWRCWLPSPVVVVSNLVTEAVEVQETAAAAALKAEVEQLRARSLP